MTTNYNFHQLQFRTRYDGGITATFRFPNGYGCSVIRGPSTYGNADGLYEMAVLDKNGICYTSGITEDVLGYLTINNVSFYMNQISQLSTNNSDTP